MFQILDELFDASGPQSKAMILAHNSHVGDARHSEMEARGEYNVGRLCREAYGAGAYLFGFWKPTAARLPLRVRRVLLLDGSYYCWMDRTTAGWIVLLQFARWTPRQSRECPT